MAEPYEFFFFLLVGQYFTGWQIYLRRTFLTSVRVDELTAIDIMSGSVNGHHHSFEIAQNLMYK